MHKHWKTVLLLGYKTCTLLKILFSMGEIVFLSNLIEYAQKRKMERLEKETGSSSVWL